MTFLERLQNNRNALGLLFMLPAAVLLLLFLTYPLGLGSRKRTEAELRDARAKHCAIPRTRPDRPDAQRSGHQTL